MLKSFRKLITCLLLCLLSLSAMAEAIVVTDENYNALYKEYLLLYDVKQTNSYAFYELSEGFKQYFRKRGEQERYYTVYTNEALYEAEHGKPFKAIEKINEMLEEMKDEDYNRHHMIHLALGTVFESRGSLRMAQYYYQQAIDETEDDPEARLSGHIRMAYLLMLKDPNKADYWNEKCGEISKKYPVYHQAYLFNKACINFTVGNKTAFNNVYKDYLLYRKEHAELDSFGINTMDILKHYFDGNTQLALRELGEPNTDVNEIMCHDMKIIIYRATGKYKQALEEWDQRTNCVDSLNGDMLFDNLNEINAASGIAQIEADASHNREILLTVLFGLSLITIILMTFWIVMHRRMSKHLKRKTEQLHSALAMAEEGAKMKTEFIRNVSHEIRTPLNAINGFNDVLNSPDIEVSATDRKDMLDRIRDNVKAITNIVDEMLHMADKESNEFYPKTDIVYCNQTLQAILYKYRNQVNSHIELSYTTNVINRFSVTTNKEGLTKIVDHLLQNAIKFTQQGYITVNCHEGFDHKSVFISVSDTGKGIAPEEQDKVFEDFYKSDVFKQGIGLGLTLSKKIAQKMGGDLNIDKEYSGGARFVLQLPID